MPRPSNRHSPLTFQDVTALAADLPDVAVGMSYGTPALKVRDKSFARMWEDGTTLVLKVPTVVRDHLLATAPAAYFVTDHYRGYPAVLVRLAVAERAQLAALVEEAWRQAAPARLVREFEARRATAPS